MADSPHSADFTPPATQPAAPTRMRHVVVAAAVLASVLLYFDRYCVAFAERYIKEGLGLSDGQMAWFLSLFFLSYAAAQVPAGWLSDRFGARTVLAVYILAWSSCTALVGLATGFIMLLVVQIGSGLAQAGAYPTCAGLLSKWVPFSNRGTASGFVILGGRIGGAAAPVCTALLIVMFVPLAVSPLLTPGELLNGAALCARLTAPPAAASLPVDNPEPALDRAGQIARHVAEFLPESVLLLIHRCGDEHRRQAAQASSGAPSVAAALEPRQTEELVAGLNVVLQRTDLYQEALFGHLKLPREAIRFLARQNDRERDGASPPTPQETARFNRLLLEAAYPAEIGKLYVKGWRQVFLVYGALGLVVAAVFWIGFRNQPDQHPWCNQAERTLIAAGRPPAAPRPTGRAGSVPWRHMVSSRSLWLSSLSQLTTNAAWLFLVSWLARYLLEVHEVPILERSIMASTPLFAGIGGMLLGGRLTDVLARRLGLKWGRRLPMAATRFLAAGAYIACQWVDSPWAATAAFVAVSFFSDLGIAAVWAFKQDVGGRYVGSILGWGNMWGNLGAFLAPHCYNAVLGKTPGHGEWNNLFLTCAGLFLVSGMAALGVDATIPIAPPDEDETALRS